ncbi:rab-GTPase-TBC domain-containing protein [Lipomyces orientalis]|uniref:Rab-GTPase-TBC domain-containing protein n=1 Tax=Lipomyces orientalis TaxID=1233043 RepID=A0ACC3TU72_9ASCO
MMDPPILFPELPQLTPQQKFRLSKESQIKEAISKGDHRTLARLAKSKGGLLSDSLRRLSWPILLGCNAEAGADPDSAAIAPHQDEEQARLDVERAFIFYPMNLSESQLRMKKGELLDVIVQVLRLHPKLSYFQGYHDIAQVIYLVFGNRKAVPVLEHLSLHRLRDFMMPTLQPALDHLNLIPPLLEQLDKPLSRHLRYTKPFYALAAVLTLFAHDVQSYSEIVLLFDFFFGCEDASIPVYLYTAITVHRRDEVFEFPAKESEMIHAVISRMPQPLPVSITDAMSMSLALYTQYPPSSLLPAWKNISQYSILRTWHFPDPQVNPASPPPSPNLSFRRRHRRRRRTKGANGNTNDSDNDEKLHDEYDYIELNEVQEKPQYDEMEAILEKQIADSAARADRERILEEKSRTLRQQKKQRRTSTKRLASAISKLPRLPGTINVDESQQTLQPVLDEKSDVDRSMVLLHKSAILSGINAELAGTDPDSGGSTTVPPQVNGTASRPRFNFNLQPARVLLGLNPNSFAALSLSICIGIFGVWIAWFLRGANWL